MILDDLIAFFFGLFGAVFGGIFVGVFNIFAFLIELIVGLFSKDYTIQRKENPWPKKSRPSDRDSDRDSGTLNYTTTFIKRPHSRIVTILSVLAILCVIGLLSYPLWGNRTITFVAADGHSAPKVEVLIQTSTGTTRERTDLVGKLRIPRFSTQRLTIHSSRFVGKSWTKDEIKSELIIERTVLGSSLDKVGGLLLKKAFGPKKSEQED